MDQAEHVPITSTEPPKSLLVGLDREHLQHVDQLTCEQLRHALRDPAPPEPILMAAVTAPADFVQGWFAGARGFRRGTATQSYAAGYLAGCEWRSFHGSGRKPHDGHAADALRLEAMRSDVGPDLLHHLTRL